MISIEQSDNLVNVAVLGEMTLADYKQFEDHFVHAVRFRGKPNVLVDLRDMVSYTVDVAWEDLKFGRAHLSDFGRVAVVTRDQWITWAAWLARVFTSAQIEVFEDYEEARAWAGGGQGAGE